MTLGNGYSLVHNDVNILENILEKKTWSMADAESDGIDAALPQGSRLL